MFNVDIMIMRFIVGRCVTLHDVFPKSKVCPSSSPPSELESLDSKGLGILLYSVSFMMDARGNHNPSQAERDNQRVFSHQHDKDEHAVWDNVRTMTFLLRLITHGKQYPVVRDSETSTTVL